jgi:hypothetical protein
VTENTPVKSRVPLCSCPRANVCRERRISIILLPRNQQCLRQTQSSTFSPQIRAALDNLSTLTIQVPVRCDRCGFVMMPVIARLRLHGSQSPWNFTLPVCGQCDYEALKAPSSPVQAIKQGVM